MNCFYGFHSFSLSIESVQIFAQATHWPKTLFHNQSSFSFFLNMFMLFSFEMYARLRDALKPYEIDSAQRPCWNILEVSWTPEDTILRSLVGILEAPWTLLCGSCVTKLDLRSSTHLILDASGNPWRRLGGFVEVDRLKS